MTSARCEGTLDVRTALREGARALAEAGCDEPRLDAELLLAHALGVTRTHLLTHPEQRLTPAEEGAFRAAVARRQEREPLAYVVGKREFYGLDLVVDRRVLVPRPESELIVERLLAFAARRPITTVWDVGTGSGALALAVAHSLPGARVVASDVSAAALDVAAVNRDRLGLSRQVKLVRADLLAAAGGPIDAVVANLPYLSSEEYAQAMPEVSRFEPPVALDAGPTGLEAVARLLAQAAWLEPAPALLLIEIGAAQGPEAEALARRFFPAHSVALRKDLAGLDRVLEIEAGPVRPPGAAEGPGGVLPADPGSIAFAAEALRRGEVVAFPTDTVYGLGAALFRESAIRALYEIKGRPEVKAIPLLLADAADLGGVVAHVPPLAAGLVRRYWPGPLTLVMQAGPEVPQAVLAGGSTVAVRVPDHPVARALIRAVGAPLATTSANRSGAPEALTASEVVEQLGHGARWVIDGGRSPGGRPSTVVDLSVEPPAIRRPGAVPVEELLPLLKCGEEAPPRERSGGSTA
ncbi:MAG: peptide chain release factor N(5)-glutamine methyltransferase [Anaerolineae bacterium]|nr:peptide chain release factor N(5)-glutamine methyltransferase [Anaerolineae bacterium]